jgi:hypothetical protein
MNIYYSARVAVLLALLTGPAGIFQIVLRAQSTRPSTQKEIKVVDPLNPSNGSVAIKAASGTATYTLQLPSVAPTANQFLGVTSVSAGVASMAWSTPSTSIGSGSGSNGQVTYWNGTNSQAGSNDLFWDASSKRLGIGTVSPSDKLSISEPLNADVTASMIARGGDNRRSQLTFGVKTSSSNTLGAAIGSDGRLSGGLILNGRTNDISTSAPDVFINPTGELCVNTTTDNGNYKVQINGDLYATSARFTNVANSGYFASLSIQSNGTLTTSSSDQRLKKNIETIKDPLNKVMSLRGVTYNWKDSSMPKRMMGMIAQEVLDVAPELVFENKATGYYGINYGETSGLLIEAIKEQQKLIQELKNGLSSQKAEINSLKQQLNSLKPKL